jgi:AcrR family transcriptional regulator
MTSDHRSRPRRRGKALNAAIFAAVLAELREVGYARLTMERVAERAKASKASLYRRWQTRIELVLDAVYAEAPDLGSPPDTGTLRGDLLVLMRGAAQLMLGPAGEAMRGLLSDVLGSPERTAQLRHHSQGASRKAVLEIVRRAAARGEIPAGSVTPRRLEVGQAMLRQHFLFHGLPIPDDVMVGIVDEILIPLFSSALPEQRRPGSA